MRSGALRAGTLVLTLALGPLDAGAQTPLPTPLQPTKGDTIPAFDTVSVDGSSQKVDFPKGSTTVLLFFLSGCPSCHKMIPEWNRAFERKSPKLRVIGVIMDQEPTGFFATTPVAFPVVRSPGRDFVTKLKIMRAPAALRVTAGGALEDVALGVVDGIRVGEIFRP